MAVLLVIVGILAALASGTITALTVGQVPGIVVAIAVLVIVVVALRIAGALARLVLVALVVLFVASIAFGGVSVAQVLSAMRNTTGPADPADPAAVADAKKKVDESERQAGFRLQLTQRELQAVVQDALASSDVASPVKRADLQISDGPSPETGTIDFTLAFKGGSLTATGKMGAHVESGGIALDVREIRAGQLSAPGLARGAVEDLVTSIFDVNDRFAKQHASVQSVAIGKGQLVILGTQANGAVITSTDLLGALAENAKKVANAAVPPAERLGPGDVNAKEADGARYYVAIGDSLAANVGVGTPREGYVSRLHKQLQTKDSASYGLRNFGISGETSGSLIRGGQLDDALSFMRSHQVAYVTIDIGANDLLGHIGSADCANDLKNPPCQERLTNTLVAYRPNLSRILTSIKAASKDARVVFIGMYNPFSLGFGAGVGLEAATDDAATKMNAIAQEVTVAHGFRYADAQTPLKQTAAATTHMTDSPSDIHPKSAGYDILAFVALEASK